MSLKVSVSGIRGVWGESLTVDVLREYTQAFGMMLLERASGFRVRVLMGRDGRKTGPMIAQYVAALLNAMGIDVLDAGLVPTPSILFGVREWHFDGGIIITASHNPIEWNALKFVVRGGTFTTEKDLESILAFVGKPFPHATWRNTGTTIPMEGLVEAHIERVLSVVNNQAIQEKKYRVVLDPVNSAGGPITTKLLEALGCTVIGVNTELTGEFGRVAEPTPANLAHLPELVQRYQADVAFAQDPDADRLVIADETGKILSEEWTLALAVRHVLSKTPGPVVVNLSTSLLSEIFAAQAGQPCYYARVGEAHVVEEIKKRVAVIGGEGNGGVIYPLANLGRDSLVGIALTLEAMAVSGRTLSALVQDFPSLFSIKEKFSGSLDITTVIEKLKSFFPEALFHTLDGVRMDMTRGRERLWVHLRSSNTEPIVRLIGESTDERWLSEVIEKIRSLF
ncbi:MAG: phosphoglucosamine mutase [Brevinematales bacterium]